MATKTAHIHRKQSSWFSRHSKLTTTFSFVLALCAVLISGVVNGESAFACKIADSRLNEASGLAASLKHPGVVYTHNDEKGPIFAINATTCKTVGAFTVNGLRSDPDPEAITLDHTTGKIWFGDIGNGHPTQPKSMTSKPASIKHPGWPARIVVFDEPSKLSGTISGQIVNITFPGGDKNAEALLSNPKTGQGYIITKYASSGVYKLPHPIKSGQATDTGVRIPGWVTDATFTDDGQKILIRYRTATDPAPDVVLVYDAASWKQIGKIVVPNVPQGESITMEKGGAAFFIGSEGTNSPLLRVAMPSSGQSAPPVGSGSTTGDAIPSAITEARCNELDRKVLTVSGKKYCAKRSDTNATNTECVAPKSGYAKFTYIVDASGDYCGYW